MKNDLRFCDVCEKQLLKQDRYGFVLIVRCDFCFKLVHESCYLIHHQENHHLIAVIHESSEKVNIENLRDYHDI
ncbi:MAG: hypothetical protein ACXAC8_06725 [Candidatus Hodarchaeales archaeon]|jgi:hypothetical protein